MNSYEDRSKRDHLIWQLRENHICFQLLNKHNAHVMDWYRALPALISQMRSAGHSDKEIATTFSISASAVRWHANAEKNAWSMDIWEERIDDAPGKILWHSELPANLAIILEDLGMRSKDDCAILASDHFETYRRMISIKDQLIPLKTLNILRAWIGAPEYVIRPKQPTQKEIDKALRVLAAAKEFSADGLNRRHPAPKPGALPPRYTKALNEKHNVSEWEFTVPTVNKLA